MTSKAASHIEDDLPPHDPASTVATFATRLSEIQRRMNLVALVRTPESIRRSLTHLGEADRRPLQGAQSGPSLLAQHRAPSAGARSGCVASRAAPRWAPIRSPSEIRKKRAPDRLPTTPKRLLETRTPLAAQLATSACYLHNLL